MRRFIVVAALGLVAASLSLSAPALAGGGGCATHPGNELTDETANEVRMAGNCFIPTVVRVEPGETVTFSNDEETIHSVAGAGGAFGHPFKEMGLGDEFSPEFSEEGVFPYFCAFHPGMIGAVVVGDGVGEAVTSLDETDAEAATAGAPRGGDGGSDTRALAVGGLFLGIAFLGVVSLLRRRRAGAAV